MYDEVFSPSFGNRPSFLVGREQLLDQLEQGLQSRPGSRERAVVILGQRGSGKTVLLWELADRMRKQGFAVANPTIVSDGMLERILEKLEDDCQLSADGKLHLSGGSVGALGFSADIQLERDAATTKSPQQRLVQLCRQLTAKDRGALILIDELQASSPEVRHLIGTYQEMVGERLNVSLVMAGLPGAVSTTLNDRVLTFLNRARKITLPPLEQGEVDAFFKRSFDSLGIAIASDLRRDAAAYTAGSPYLLQLVGHYTCLYAENGKVSEESLAEALRTSGDDFQSDVCATTLAALSERDVNFLEAMAVLGDPAPIAAIAEAMGATVDYAQKYRRRLIEGGVIKSAGRGKVAFDVPFLAEHLRKRNE